MAEIDSLDSVAGFDKRIFVKFVWDWFFDNATTIKIPVKIWIINTTIPLKDLQWLFERIFGAPPYSE